MNGRTYGPYRVLSRLGEGGLATVWLAEEPRLGRKVALKVLKESFADDPEIRQRFLNEARLAATLDHPGIASVWHAGQEGDELFIAYRLVQGDTVSALAQRGPLPMGDVLDIAVGAAEALGVAHARNVIHRDVTGRNIMLDRDGNVVVLDFGLALVEGATRLTRSGTRMGTLAYLAPELYGSVDADARSDIFGLGVVLFEALTGRLPFEGDRAEVISYAIVALPPPEPRRLRPETPVEFERILLRMLEKDPDDRYPNVQALLAELKAVRDGRPVNAAAAVPERRWDVAPPVYGRYVAVLPFAEAHVESDRADDDARLAAGLAEAVAAMLGQSDVRVIPPSVVPADALRLDPRHLAQQLGATLLLRGDMRKVGPQIRVSLSLHDPYRGIQVGARTVSGSSVHFFELEDAVVDAVRDMLVPDTASESRATRVAPDPAVHERYLQALGYLQRRDNEAMVDGAITLLERMPDTYDPARVKAALARAYLSKYRLTQAPRWENAAAVAAQAAAESGRLTSQVLVTLGELHVSSGRNEQALNDFQKALDLDAADGDAAIGLGLAYQALQRPDEAEAAFQRAIRLRPGYWLAYRQLGLFLFSQGRYEQAILAWERVVELLPDNARTHKDLGVAHHALGRRDQAIAAFERSLELQPDPLTYSNLGTLHFYEGQYDRAAADFKRAVLLSPSNPRTWGNLGSAMHFVPGAEAESRDALRHAVRLLREQLDRNPTMAEEWAVLGGWLADLGERDAALEAIHEAIRLAPDDVTVAAKAGINHYQLGLHDEAYKWFRNALSRGYSSARLLRDPYIPELRNDERFHAIMEELGLTKPLD